MSRRGSATPERFAEIRARLDAVGPLEIAVNT